MKLLEGEKKAKLMSLSKKRRNYILSFHKRGDFKHMSIETLLLKLSFALSSNGQLRRPEEIVSGVL